MLVDMWRVVWPQREIFNRLTHHHLPFIDQEALQYYLRDVSDHLLWITDMVNTFRDTITGIMDLYMSAVSNRLNQVVNRLTVFALVIGVLTVIGGFYGMNFAQTWPPFADPWGVPFVVGMMVVITGVLLALFRWMGWY
jgi:magnesium transporter